MKIRTLLLVLTAGVAFTSCSVWGVRGNGHVREESRNISEFTRLEAGGAYSIKVFVGKTASLKISAEENLLPLIKTVVRGNTLIIDTKKSLSPRKEIRIMITTPNLTSIDVSGANNVEASGINCDEFEAELSGAGSVDLEGKVERFRAELSGAGNIDAKNLKANEVSISVSGAASADVYAKEKLDASVSGVGSIDYYGDPVKTKTNVSGVGSISRK
jgi:hypothetical protein